MRILIFILGFVIVSSVSAQTSPKVTESSSALPKYKVAFASEGEVLILRFVVKPKFQTEGNLTAIAREVRCKYRNFQKINFMIFDNKDDAREFEVYRVAKIPQTLRAMYQFDREASIEKLYWIEWLDGKIVEKPIEI